MKTHPILPVALALWAFAAPDIAPSARADEPAGPPWARTWCPFSRQAYLSRPDDDWDGLNSDEERLRLALWGEVETNAWAWVASTGAANIGEWTWAGVDDDVQPVALPFAFPWGTQTWNRVWVGVNGTLGFGRGQPSPTPRPLPSATAGPYPFFAVFWRQLYVEPGAGGRVWTRSPDAQRFVVCWENLWVSNAANSRVSFQAELRSNGEMVWRYRDLDGGAGNVPDGIVGVQRDGFGWGLDGRGLRPSLALRVATLPAVSAANADSDADGAADSIEFFYYHPTNAAARSLSPLRYDPKDLDRDGLDVTGEFLHGRLDPFHWDSDGDLLSDGYEVATRMLATSPTGIHGPAGDADADGVTNIAERLHRSQPRLADSDGDGRADAAEIQTGSSPVGTGTVASAEWLAPVQLTLGDPGLDGATEAYEMRIDPLSGDTRSFTFQNTAYGSVQTQTVRLVIGAKYRVSLNHLGTIRSRNGVCDSDYDASVAAVDGTVLTVTDPTSLLGRHLSSTPVSGGAAPIDTNRSATVWIQSRVLPDGTTPVVDPALTPSMEAWMAGRGTTVGPVPETDLVNPGVLVLPGSLAAVMGTITPARIRVHALGDVAGVTRWLRFSDRTRISLQPVGGVASVPATNEVQIAGATDVDADFDLRMNGTWPVGTTVTVDCVVRNSAGQAIAVRSVRLLGPLVFAIGDSMTYGVRRRRDGTMETPNWGNPWLSYPSPSSWDRYYGNWNDINFQGYRGFMRRDLTAVVPWVGHYANGHGPDHCGYSGSRTGHINSTLDETSRAYPRNAALAGPSYTVVLYWIGLNDTGTSSSAGAIFDAWKGGINRILNLRSGKGRTLIVGITLPRIRSDYAGYSSSRQAKQDVVNSMIRGYTLSSPYARYVVANIEGVPHDSDDDGLHYMATGYGRVEEIVRQSILSGLRAGQ